MPSPTIHTLFEAPRQEDGLCVHLFINDATDILPWLMLATMPLPPPRFLYESWARAGRQKEFHAEEISVSCHSLYFALDERWTRNFTCHFDSHQYAHMFSLLSSLPLCCAYMLSRRGDVRQVLDALPTRITTLVIVQLFPFDARAERRFCRLSNTRRAPSKMRHSAADDIARAPLPAGR